MVLHCMVLNGTVLYDMVLQLSHGMKLQLAHGMVLYCMSESLELVVRAQVTKVRLVLK